MKGFWCKRDVLALDMIDDILELGPIYYVWILKSYIIKVESHRKLRFEVKNREIIINSNCDKGTAKHLWSAFVASWCIDRCLDGNMWDIHGATTFKIEIEIAQSAVG